LQDLQAGVDRYNQLQGGSERATQELVNAINDVTKSYTLYRQLAFVAHTIWESGAYKYKEEIAATTGCCTRYDYQRCTDNSIVPNGDLAYYGRGYIQLSWCYNYEAYGRARLVNGDPNYFKNNPNAVAQLPYAVDSAAWFFETNVADRSGQFGLTTRAINGIECNGSGHHAPPKRFQIFEAMAQRVGLTGYSAAGC
jgi:predicted chitinase